MKFVRKYGLLLLIVILLAVTIFIWYVELSRNAPQTHNKELKVFYLDIGQGDATLIEAPNGNQALIDGGNVDNKVLRELGEVMSPLDHSLDVVIATHPDADHVGGLPQVLEQYQVDTYIDSGNLTKDTQIFKTLTDKVSKKVSGGMKYLHHHRGQRVVLDAEDNVYIDVLYPDRDVSNVESNEASFVGRLVYGSTCFMFSGDAPQDVEHIVVSYEKAQKQNSLQCQVLKTGHHGSKTSTSAEWLTYIQPQYAVISVGKNNRYGHPHQIIIDSLATYGVNILRTDLLGRIEIDSDGVGVTIK